MSISYAYVFADPLRLARVFGSKDPRLEAVVHETPRCWISEDEETEDHILAEIIDGAIVEDREPHLQVLVFHWIASAIGTRADENADEDDGVALEGDLVRSVNPALKRLGEAPLLEAESADHPFLPTMGLAMQAADSVVCSMFSAADCDRAHTLLSTRWADFTPDEIEVVGPLKRLLHRRRYHDVLLQLLF